VYVCVLSYIDVCDIGQAALLSTGAWAVINSALLDADAAEHGHELVQALSVARVSLVSKLHVGMRVRFISPTAITTLVDILSPTDNITASSTNSPPDEGAANVLDRTKDTKYLNFDKRNTGFTVTPGSGASVATALSLTTANDAPERDPASWQIHGSNDGKSFALIASGAMPADKARFRTETMHFSNCIPYTSYKVIFPTVVDSSSANSMQICNVAIRTRVARQDFRRLDEGELVSLTSDQVRVKFGTISWSGSVDHIEPVIDCAPATPPELHTRDTCAACLNGTHAHTFHDPSPMQMAESAFHE
jgi:hypothetical protein